MGTLYSLSESQWIPYATELGIKIVLIPSNLKQQRIKLFYATECLYDLIEELITLSFRDEKSKTFHVDQPK